MAKHDEALTTLPPPERIRSRLDDVLFEADVLRGLLRLSEREQEERAAERRSQAESGKQAGEVQAGAGAVNRTGARNRPMDGRRSKKGGPATTLARRSD
jgi:hypothetical protein